MKITITIKDTVFNELTHVLNNNGHNSLKDFLSHIVKQMYEGCADERKTLELARTALRNNVVKKEEPSTVIDSITKGLRNGK